LGRRRIDFIVVSLARTGQPKRVAYVEACAAWSPWLCVTISADTFVGALLPISAKR
jgi:hypothetical protein